MAARGAKSYYWLRSNLKLVRFLNRRAPRVQQIDGALVDIHANDIKTPAGDGGCHARTEFGVAR